jgi:hypothetical protein
MRLVGAIRHAPPGRLVDYELHFAPCREVRVYIIHLTRLAPEIERRIPVFDDLCPAGADFCIERTNIVVAAGQPLGVFDSSAPMAFDLGLVDTRRPPNAFVRPERYRLPDRLLAGLTEEQLELVERVAPDDLHQHCPLDYFRPALRAAMEALLGSFDGSARRTALPLCGVFVQDVPVGAPGNWFRDDEDTVFDEERGIALARDHVDPTQPVLSLGAAGTTLPTGAWTFAVGTPSGRINADFDAIVPGAVYCYQGLTRGTTPLAGIVLIELFASPGAPLPDRLRVEHVPAASSCASASGFSGGALVFQR